MSHYEPLSNADTAWLRMDDPTNLMMICGVMIFDRPLDRERLRRTIAERLLVYDRFRQRIVNRHRSPAWQDDPLFKLDTHLHRVALPSPGGQAEIEELVADLLATPLDPNTPLWQIHLVDRFGEGSAMIVRLHHCIADGIALVRLLLSMTDTSPAGAPRRRSRTTAHEIQNPLRALFRPAERLASGAVATAQALFREGVDLIRHPAHGLDLARESVDVAQTVVRLALLRADSDTMFRGPRGVAKRATWTGGIKLEDVRAIGHALGGTVNDVLLCALAGSLRRYLHDHERPVAGVELRIIMPVDLRPSEDVLRLGNRFGLVFVELPVGMEHPAARLHEIAQRTKQIKGSLDAAVAFGVLQVIGMASSEVERQAIDLFSQKATAVVTNVPGPQQKLYLAGAQLTRLMFWVPQSGRIALGVSILSYDHEVSVGVTSDAGLVPDPQCLVIGIKKELAALAALVRRRARKRTKHSQAKGG
jgi:WS/DGAT/MGAT family acyltransferase